MHLAQFGDGYEQRLQDGINSLKQEISVSFQTRPKAEIDDLVAFFESLNGVTKFRFDIADSNASKSTETIKVVCPDWEQKWEYDDYYALDATLEGFMKHNDREDISKGLTKTRPRFGSCSPL